MDPDEAMDVGVNENDDQQGEQENPDFDYFDVSSETDETEGYFGDDEYSPWSVQTYLTAPTTVEDPYEDKEFGRKWFGIHKLMLWISTAASFYRFDKDKASSCPIEESIPDTINSFLKHAEHRSLVKRIIAMFAADKIESIAPVLMARVFRSVVTVATANSENIKARRNQCDRSLKKLFCVLCGNSRCLNNAEEENNATASSSSPAPMDHLDNNGTAQRGSSTPIAEWPEVSTSLFQNEVTAETVMENGEVGIQFESVDVIHQYIDNNVTPSNTAPTHIKEWDNNGTPPNSARTPMGEWDNNGTPPNSAPTPMGEWPDVETLLLENGVTSETVAENGEIPIPQFESIDFPEYIDNNGTAPNTAPTPMEEWPEVKTPVFENEGTTETVNQECEVVPSLYECIAELMDHHVEEATSYSANGEIANAMEQEVEYHSPEDEDEPKTTFFNWVILLNNEEATKYWNSRLKKSLRRFNAFMERLWSYETQTGDDSNKDTINDPENFGPAIADFSAELLKTIIMLLNHNGNAEECFENLATSIRKCMLKENKSICQLFFKMCNKKASAANDPSVPSLVDIILDLIRYGLNDVRPVVKIIDQTLRSESMKTTFMDTSVISLASAATIRLNDFAGVVRSQPVERIQDMIFRITDILSLQLYLLQALLVHMVVIRARFASQVLKQVILKLDDSTHKSMKNDLYLLKKCYDFLEQIGMKEALNYLESPLVE